MNWTTFLIIVLSAIGLLAITLFVYYLRLKLSLIKLHKLPESLPKMAGGSSLDKMDKMLKEAEISKGKLSFLYHDEMRTGKKYRIACLITRAPILVIEEKEHAIVHEIPVTDLMSCSLFGDAFAISKINNEAQRIWRHEPTSWEWDVVPKKWGTQNLLLRASIHIKSDNDTHVKDIPVFEREVVISINPTYHVKQFFIKHWQWFVGTIIGSGIIWQILNNKK